MADRVVTGALFRSAPALDGVLWPAVPGRAAADLLSQLYQLDQTQYLPLELLRARQLQQFALLARHAAETCPFYRQRFEGSGLRATEPWSWSRFASLAILTRRELLSDADRIHSQRVPAAHGAWHELQTSGSTGEVVAVRRTGINQLLWLALSMRDHLWHRRDFRKCLAVIRAGAEEQSDEASARRNGWGPPVSLLHETGPCYTLPLSTDVSAQLDWLLEKDPDYLLTYPTNLQALLDRFERGAPRPRNLRHIRTIGETLSPALRARCAELLSASVVDAYSAQEVGAIALECPETGLYHVHAESLIVEVLREDNSACAIGESGRVVVTDLHNFATPLIRYELRDYAEVGPPCACGRTLPTLKRILGRQRNMIVLPTGQRYWPLVGLHHFREAARILQYQLVQHALDDVELRLVVAERPDAAAEARLIDIVQRALGHPFPLRLTYVQGDLARTPGGKFEEFVSHVA